MEEECLRDYIWRLIDSATPRLSQTQASFVCELSPGYIPRLLRGELSNPKPKTLKKIARGLGGDYAYMLALAGLAPEQHIPQGSLVLRLTHAFDQLSPHCQEAVIAVIETLVELEKKRENPR